jgi:hypothetical protein
MEVKLNTARSGRRDQRGLVIWKKFDAQLSDSEVQKEIISLENEGFQVVAVKNSETMIVAVTSEGLAYSTSRLLKVGYEWERLVETHNQLTSIAQVFVKTGMIKGEDKLHEHGNRLRGKEWGLRDTEGLTERSGDK